MKHPTAYRWAGVAFLVAAGVAAVMIRRPNGEPPAKAAPDADVSTRGGEEGGAADGLELGRARERIAALEQELERMRAAQARTEALLAELKPIAEMLKDARSGGALDAPDPDEKAFAAAMMGPRTASDLLNLDPARRQEFKRAFDEAVGQIRSLERSRARVSEDGAKTRIDSTTRDFPKVSSMATLDRDKALDMALAQIDKQFGKGSVMRLGDTPAQAMKVIPTGSIALDIALGIGGLPRGRVIEVYGPEASGKTTVALHAVA
ncbi:MAG TPA: hypothetical protein VEJ18_08125, partial [Planctomycetota bacterium]|nr:hypothetical protein [Planctomycetota bacterium]